MTTNAIASIWLFVAYILALTPLSPLAQAPPFLRSPIPYNPSAKYREVLIAAGNFTLGNSSVNVAQYDVASGIWSNVDEIDLYLYGESNGVIWDIAVNGTDSTGSKMFLVGAFDTITKTSQVQYCSVGAWDGFMFSKVGEGLCPRGGDPSSVMHIQTTVIGNNGDIFVGGSFESRVWDGSHFVNVYHVARFDSTSSSWLPLKGGQLLTGESDTQETLVTSLAWDANNAILYIGGIFSFIDDEPISTGLAMWTLDRGLETFPGTGLSFPDPAPEKSAPGSGNFSTSNKNEYYSEVLIAFEPFTESLFVSGSFIKVNGDPCPLVAAWHKRHSTWRCLLSIDEKDSENGIGGNIFLDISAMHLTSGQLVVAGRADPLSWDGDNAKTHRTPNLIAVLNIEGYIVEHSIPVPTPTLAPSSLQPASQKNTTALRSLLRINSDGLGGSGPTPVRIASKNDKRMQRRIAFLRQQKEYQLEQYHRYYHQHRALHPSKDGNSSTPTITPPSSPYTPWTPQWRWLPGFGGTDMPIRRINSGFGRYEGALFIAGAFTNCPSIVIWQRNSSGVGIVRAVNPRYSLTGLVTSVVQTFIPNIPPDTKDRAVVAKKDYTLAILLSCLCVGIVLGISVAVSWSNSAGYSRIDDHETGHALMSIPLKTLSGGADSIDLRRCFERAMIARHLPTHEILLIINPKEIVLSRIIGEGSFGRVWSGQWRNNAVAVKEFVFAQAAMESLERNNIIEEIVGEAGIMACLRHPKILQLYGCTITMQAIWIVSELCCVGSLRMLLNDESVELSTAQKLSICLDVADGMLYLHTRSPPIIHRDLKSHNIFITESPSTNRHFVAKIGDWGSARAIAMTGAKSMTNGVGTACWLAPEVINYAHSSKGSDVYAYGVVLWEIWTGQEVHEGLSAAQIIARVANEGLRPQVPWDCPWAQMMTGCWTQDAQDRPSFARIMRELSIMLHRIVPGSGMGIERGIGSPDLGAEYRNLLAEQGEALMDLDAAEMAQLAAKEQELVANIGLNSDCRAEDMAL